MGKTKTVYLDEMVIKMVDDWRRTQSEIPNFSKAVETLITKGVENLLVS